jgi:XTP/dITP diphosphohydrolase
MLPQKIFLASSNRHKVSEFESLFRRELPEVELTSVLTYPQLEQVVAETGQTYQENAYLKAQAYAALVSEPILADDSGVEVNAFPGLLGVNSHRFHPGTDEDRTQALLAKLRGVKDRRLVYRVVLCYLVPGEPAQYFVGELTGAASLALSSGEGFGYDPLMIPDGYQQTLSALGQTIKNQLSHRARAVEQLSLYLRKAAT